uniref:Uncharacterized protein n=1 Tax=Hanusia phi TaxID=3032 RepID=A0A7S0HRQ7_9CRYP|mmetsp:Transcript_30374/g.68656  ORF Transcript_30374/g.68656 Transcript_30374/m.68656 type:complete len:345 (+) Transcript_30374:333-1367(+)
MYDRSMRFLDVIVGTRVVRLVILLILICAPADGDVQEENSSMVDVFQRLLETKQRIQSSPRNFWVSRAPRATNLDFHRKHRGHRAGFLARDQMLSQPGDTGNDIRIYRHGIEDPNSTVFQEIREADSMVTEPDDIVKLEEEVRALQSKIRMQKVLISNSSNVSAAAKNIPGEFRWIENWEMHGEKPTNASNETLGLWIWCKNSSNFAKIHWQNGTLIGAPAINASQTFQTVKGCVSVVSPAWMEVDESAGEDTKKEEKEEEEEMQEIRRKNWDEPFMTYEPHPSSVGWNKKHWKASDWITWTLTGPLLSLSFMGFIWYSFGWLPGVAVFATCALVDVATFYWNW